MFGRLYASDVDINESIETMINIIDMTNTVDIDRLNDVTSKLYLIQVQRESQDEIYQKVIKLKTTFITIIISTKLEFRIKFMIVQSYKEAAKRMDEVCVEISFSN